MKAVREMMVYVLSVFLFVSALMLLSKVALLYETAYEYLTKYITHPSIRVVTEGE